MAPDISQELCPLHPSPDEWLIPSRLEALQVQISPVIRLLKLSGLYKSVLNYWVRLEVAQEISLSDNERSNLLADLKPKWLEKNPSLVDIFDDKDLETKLLASPSVAKWSEQQWGHRVESLYLKRKSTLDRASCHFLTVQSKDLANELYHRLKSNEASFATICNTFTPDQHGVRGAYYKLQPLKSLPLGLDNLLARLNVGSITKPLPLGEKFCIVQLDQYLPRELDSSTRQELLSEQFMLWSDNMVLALMQVLELE